MTPHSPAFASALAAVEALLGPADATASHPVVGRDGRITVASWRRDGAHLTVRAYDDVPDVVLVAERIDGDARAWTAIGDGTVRDACAWLSWEVPRPPRVGYDANGSPVEAA